MPVPLEQLLSQEGFRRSVHVAPRSSIKELINSDLKEIQQRENPTPRCFSVGRCGLDQERSMPRISVEDRCKTTEMDADLPVHFCRDEDQLKRLTVRTRSSKIAEIGDKEVEIGISGKGRVGSKGRLSCSMPETNFPIRVCREGKGETVTPRRSGRSTPRQDVELESRVPRRSWRGCKSETPFPRVRSSRDDCVDVEHRAIVSILSGFAGKFIKEERIRVSTREKCLASLETENPGKTRSKLELGIEMVERLAENRDLPLSDLQDSVKEAIRLLRYVSRLHGAEDNRNESRMRIPNFVESACSHLYLSVAYKLMKNDKGSAKHLLQVFCDSPAVARTLLLPEFWDYVFLPHLLHLKVWYGQEIAYLREKAGEETRNMRALSGVYNEQMDVGTLKFAFHYREWVEKGVKSTDFPEVSVPSRPKYSYSQPLIKMNLQSIIGCQERLTNKRWDSSRTQLLPETWTSEYHHPFSCQRESFPEPGMCGHGCLDKGNTKEVETSVPFGDLDKAIKVICTSDNLTCCEIAVRLLAKAWLDAQGDPAVESSLSKIPVIEGLLRLTSISDDDEVIELAISILAELVVRNKVNRLVILSADPQLNVFMRLLKNKNLYLKVAVLLHVIKPRARQMVSHEFLELILKVLEHGDRTQSLFTVTCSPRAASLYLLEQLLSGFDIDKNMENARQVVSLGGLHLLVRTLDIGDTHERKSSARLLNSCMKGDPSCKYYLAENISKSSILELLISSPGRSSDYALLLLIELLSLDRVHITKFLSGLKNDGCLNTMHVLLAYLQRAPLEQQSLIAAVLLKLDLQDSEGTGVCRQDVVDVIIAFLDCNAFGSKVQEQTGRALLLLGGCYSFHGEASIEGSLLKYAGLDDTIPDAFDGKPASSRQRPKQGDHEKFLDECHLNIAVVLLSNGRTRFLEALSTALSYGIPSFARACLVTLTWISHTLASYQLIEFQVMVCSVFSSQLVECLKIDKSVEERVLASMSLLSFAKTSDCMRLLSAHKVVMERSLRSLVQTTWTAKELLLILSYE